MHVQKGVGVDVDAELATILSSTYFSDSFTFDKAADSPVTRKVCKRTDTNLSSIYFSDSFTSNKAAGNPVTRKVSKRRRQPVLYLLQ